MGWAGESVVAGGSVVAGEGVTCTRKIWRNAGNKTS